MIYDSIVIGGGPAGMTAALYLLRAGKSVLILEREAFGGQIAESPRLENFPSVASISGLDFSDHLFEQISALGVEFDVCDVQSVEKTEEGFKVITDYGEKEGKTIIIATGCKHRKLGLDREEELTGKGISYCAVCDGAFYTGKDVLLIGDANTALQYAIMLSETSKHVQVVTLFDKFFADDILIKRMNQIQNIDFVHEFEAVRFEGEEELVGVTFKDKKTGELKTFPCDGCFIAIGQIPDNDRFASWVDLDKGFIVVDEGMATKTPGIYAAGDCRVKKIRQVITATSDGAIAAMSAANYLNSK
ncbi:MAG: FAD-dependent oxidoreductase [Bacilli bacterium]|nr:FAD-dependent oxidoreductase [Bacilli bacterium]